MPAKRRSIRRGSRDPRRDEQDQTPGKCGGDRSGRDGGWKKPAWAMPDDEPPPKQAPPPPAARLPLPRRRRPRARVDAPWLGRGSALALLGGSRGMSDEASWTRFCGSTMRLDSTVPSASLTNTRSKDSLNRSDHDERRRLRRVLRSRASTCSPLWPGSWALVITRSKGPSSSNSASSSGPRRRFAHVAGQPRKRASQPVAHLRVGFRQHDADIAWRRARAAAPRNRPLDAAGLRLFVPRGLGTRDGSWPIGQVDRVVRTVSTHQRAGARSTCRASPEAS